MSLHHALSGQSLEGYEAGQASSYLVQPRLGLSEHFLNDSVNININPGHLGNVNLSSLSLRGNKVETLLATESGLCTRVRELMKLGIRKSLECVRIAEKQWGVHLEAGGCWAGLGLISHLCHL